MCITVCAWTGNVSVAQPRTIAVTTVYDRLTITNVIAEAMVVEESPPRPIYIAAKTNMLFDALLVPNVSAEAYVGCGLSVGAEWMYGWWDKNRLHRYWRLYGGDIYMRRWFGSAAAGKPLTGHHIGIFAGVNTYDFEFGGVGHMGGYPGRNIFAQCNVVAGVEYGYSLPVAPRINIDFTIGVGYLGGKYFKYIPDGDIYLWQETRHLNWVGPVKAEISLVWLIGRGNVNQLKKGGMEQ